MKRCQKCKAEYFDDSLEFCLEDGTRLIQVASSITSNEKTEVLNDFNAALPFNSENQNQTNLQNRNTNKLAGIKEKITYKGYRTIEIAPIILALAHNYWQWLYLNKTAFPDTISFLTSSNFFGWLLLLFIGAIVSFIALKYGKYKGFAITSLVILAINLLLSLVPNK